MNNVVETRPAGGPRGAGEARFTMVQKECHGTEMRLNYETETGGRVRVELGTRRFRRRRPVEPFEGYGMKPGEMRNWKKIKPFQIHNRGNHGNEQT